MYIIHTQSIGERIRIFRVLRGLSQEELAEKSGITRFVLSQLERGSREPSLSELKTLANALDADAVDFLEKKPLEIRIL